MAFKDKLVYCETARRSFFDTVREQRARSGRGEAADAAVLCSICRAHVSLAAVPADVDIICVHDAARPLASDGVYRRVIDAVIAGADGAVPGVAVADTIKTVDTAGSVVIIGGAIATTVTALSRRPPRGVRGLPGESRARRA